MGIHVLLSSDAALPILFIILDIVRPPDSLKHLITLNRLPRNNVKSHRAACPMYIYTHF